MPLKVVAIGPAPMTRGFALAGVDTVQAEEDSAGARQLAALLSREDLGVVLADEQLAARLPDEVRAASQRRSAPVLLTVPRARWDEAVTPGANEILDLLQRAIGYRVRLQ